MGTGAPEGEHARRQLCARTAALHPNGQACSLWRRKKGGTALGSASKEILPGGQRRAVGTDEPFGPADSGKRRGDLRVEETVRHMGKKEGCTVEIIALPTAIFIMLETPEGQQTATLPLSPGGGQDRRHMFLQSIRSRTVNLGQNPPGQRRFPRVLQRPPDLGTGLGGAERHRLPSKR